MIEHDLGAMRRPFPMTLPGVCYVVTPREGWEGSQRPPSAERLNANRQRLEVGHAS